LSILFFRPIHPAPGFSRTLPSPPALPSANGFCSPIRQVLPLFPTSTVFPAERFGSRVGGTIQQVTLAQSVWTALMAQFPDLPTYVKVHEHEPSFLARIFMCGLTICLGPLPGLIISSPLRASTRPPCLRVMRGFCRIFPSRFLSSPCFFRLQVGFPYSCPLVSICRCADPHPGKCKRGSANLPRKYPSKRSNGLSLPFPVRFEIRGTWFLGGRL